MRYGYFDDDAREYVITRPDTPRSWSNYLGLAPLRRHHHAERRRVLVLQVRRAWGACCASGSTACRRTSPGASSTCATTPTATSGARRGSRWASRSATYGPRHAAEASRVAPCRHGLGYSVFDLEYRGIRSEATFFIPKDQAFEYWSVKVTNTTDAPRTISLF